MSTINPFGKEIVSVSTEFCGRTLTLEYGRFGFLSNMVRAQYPVVYRPQSVQFEKPEVVEGEFIQPVRMIDTAGRAWIALYPMQRQADGSWRINGCQLVRVAGVEA